jgi:hypothetical protein
MNRRHFLAAPAAIAFGSKEPEGIYSFVDRQLKKRGLRYEIPTDRGVLISSDGVAWTICAHDPRC